MKRYGLFISVVIILFFLLYLPISENTAIAETIIVAPLDPLVKTSGFIPNRYITWDGGSSSWSHLATDYNADEGQPVMSIADGTVKETGYNSSSGNYIVIEHSINGVTAWSRYQHFSQAPLVSNGASVKAGQQIGTAGKTGNASGPHLHIQIFSGQYPANVAWDRSVFSNYPLNQEVTGPIEKDGTVFYNPERIINKNDTIGNPYPDYLTDSIVYNAEYYRNYRENTDLKTFTDEQLLNHWFNYGIKEGRVASPVFDVNWYLDHNEGVKKAVNGDHFKAIEHFIQNGVSETRQASALFNIWTYRLNYLDLRETYGDNYYGYYLHYVKFGYKEGRVANERIAVTFDPNGGSVSVTSVEVTRGIAIGDLPEPIRDGYSFIGWYTEKEGGSRITAETVYSSFTSQTVYAHWEAKTVAPSEEPTSAPTTEPTTVPTVTPTAVPTATPTVKPTATPTATPTVKPTATPTPTPTATPEPTATPVPGPGAGTPITSGGGKYIVTVPGEVSYTGPEKSGAKITIPDTITVDGVTLKVTNIADKAFLKDKKLKTITIGANIETIGANAFKGCVKLTTVKGGAAIKEIGDNAFNGCKVLKKFPTLSELETIGAGTFKGCVKLTKFTLGEKVASIGKSAFNGCKALRTITVQTELLTNGNVGKTAFKGINKKATFKCPKTQLKAYKKLFVKKGAPKSCKFK